MYSTGVKGASGKTARLLTNLNSSVNLCTFLLVSRLGRFQELSISGYPTSQDFKHPASKL